MRDAGYYERHFVCRNVEGYYSNFNVVARYNKHFSKPLLASAIQNLINGNSIFVLNLFRNEESNRELDATCNGTNFHVRPVKSFTFNDVVSYKSIDTFDDKVFEEINGWVCPVNVELPLWRIVVFELKDNGYQHVCVYFEHALFDGGCGAEFHKDLAKALEEIETTNSEIEDKVFDQGNILVFNENLKKIDVPPACEFTTDIYDPWWSTTIGHYARRYLPSKVQEWLQLNGKNKGFTTFNCGNTNTKDISTKYKIININNQEVEKIRQFCKNNKIAITSYLQILGNLALSQTFLQYYKAPDSTTWNTTSLIAASGRRYLQRDNFQYGTLVTGHIYTMHPTSANSTRQEILSQMQKFHNQIHADLKTKSGFQNIALYQYLNFWELYANKLGKSNRFTFMVSNLGLVKMDDCKDWQISDIFFGLNTGLNYNFILNVTSTPESGLNIVLCYRPEFGLMYSLSNAGKLLIDEYTERLSHLAKEFCNE